MQKKYINIIYYTLMSHNNMDYKHKYKKYKKKYMDYTKSLKKYDKYGGSLHNKSSNDQCGGSSYKIYNLHLHEKYAPTNNKSNKSNKYNEISNNQSGGFSYLKNKPHNKYDLFLYESSHNKYGGAINANPPNNNEEPVVNVDTETFLNNLIKKNKDKFN